MAHGSPDYLIKLILVGDAGVGKSCLLRRFSQDTWSETYASTIGVDFTIHSLRVAEKTVKMQIWDTAGQDRFKSIVSAYYRGALAVCYTYDTTSLNSFESVPRWVDEVQRHNPVNCVMPTFVKVLCGTKTDKNRHREVTTEMASTWAMDNSMLHIETSSKESSNVQLLFQAIASEFVARQKKASLEKGAIETYKHSDRVVTVAARTEERSARCWEWIFGTSRRRAEKASAAAAVCRPPIVAPPRLDDMSAHSGL